MLFKKQDILIADIHIEDFCNYKFYNPIIYNQHNVTDVFIIANSVFSVINQKNKEKYSFKILSFYHHGTRKCYSYCVELGITISSQKYILNSIEGVIVCVLKYLEKLDELTNSNIMIEKLYINTSGSKLYELYHELSSSALDTVFFPMKNLHISSQRIQNQDPENQHFILDSYQVYSLKGTQI